MILKPIGKYISDEFFHGNVMVTHYSETEIHGDVRNHDVIDARVWIDRIFGYKDSSLLLKFQWSKLLPDGSVKPVAFSEQQTSWFRVESHGNMKPVECPEFFINYLQRDNLALKRNNGNKLERLIGQKNIKMPGLGEVLYERNIVNDSKTILDEGTFDTSMEDSSLSQNIYFSNYFAWQGHIRDRYFFNIDPERFRNMDRDGQLACLYSSVKHLREAMPFDRIFIDMKLQRLYECGMDLYFEYLRIESDGSKAKLAYGDHKLAWIYVDSNSNYIPLKLPKLYMKAILSKVGEKYGQHR